MFKRLFTVMMLSFLVVLVGCSSGDQYKNFKDRTASFIYNSALDLLEEGDYKGAAKAFAEVEIEHPYSDLAEKAEVMAAFSRYAAGDPSAALMIIDSYIQLYPGSELIAYAYYLQGLCYEDMALNSNRDQGASEDAIKAFKELLNRFPDSEYAKAAKLKIVGIREKMAESYMYIGRFMMVKKEYQAAVQSFFEVIDGFNDTAQAPEAYYRLVESYYAMGLSDHMGVNFNILKKKFPDSRWLKKAMVLLEPKDGAEKKRSLS